MPREIEIESLTLRLRTVRRYRRCRSLTYVEVLHNGSWLHCGDPHYGETSSASARAALLHYARTAIRDADEVNAR